MVSDLTSSTYRCVQYTEGDLKAMEYAVFKRNVCKFITGTGSFDTAWILVKAL